MHQHGEVNSPSLLPVFCGYLLTHGQSRICPRHHKRSHRPHDRRPPRTSYMAPPTRPPAENRLGSDTLVGLVVCLPSPSHSPKPNHTYQTYLPITNTPIIVSASSPSSAYSPSTRSPTTRRINPSTPLPPSIGPPSKWTSPPSALAHRA
jgi:hypothetical protein